MPSVWVERRPARSGVRFRVEYRVGGRESPSRYAGSFPDEARGADPQGVGRGGTRGDARA